MPFIPAKTLEEGSRRLAATSTQQACSLDELNRRLAEEEMEVTALNTEANEIAQLALEMLDENIEAQARVLDRQMTVTALYSEKRMALNMKYGILCIPITEKRGIEEWYKRRMVEIYDSVKQTKS